MFEFGLTFFILWGRRDDQSHNERYCKVVGNDALCPVRVAVCEVHEYPEENVETF